MFKSSGKIDLIFFPLNFYYTLILSISFSSKSKTIYEYMLEKGSLKKVVWFTYGVDDQKIAEELIKQNKLNKNIRVIGIPKILSGLKPGNTSGPFSSLAAIDR